MGKAGAAAAARQRPTSAAAAAAAARGLGFGARRRDSRQTLAKRAAPCQNKTTAAQRQRQRAAAEQRAGNAGARVLSAQGEALRRLRKKSQPAIAAVVPRARARQAAMATAARPAVRKPASPPLQPCAGGLSSDEISSLPSVRKKRPAVGTSTSARPSSHPRLEPLPREPPGTPPAAADAAQFFERLGDAPAFGAEAARRSAPPPPPPPPPPHKGPSAKELTPGGGGAALRAAAYAAAKPTLGRALREGAITREEYKAIAQKVVEKTAAHLQQPEATMSSVGRPGARAGLEAQHKHLQRKHFGREGAPLGPSCAAEAATAQGGRRVCVFCSEKTGRGPPRGRRRGAGGALPGYWLTSACRAAACHRAGAGACAGLRGGVRAPRPRLPRPRWSCSSRLGGRAS